MGGQPLAHASRAGGGSPRCRPCPASARPSGSGRTGPPGRPRATSCPEETNTTACPRFWRIRSSRVRLTGLSSATRIRLPGRGRRGGRRDEGHGRAGSSPASRCGRRMSKWNSLPSPGTLLDPDPAAHQADEARGDRQAQAGAAVLARRASCRPGRTPRRSTCLLVRRRCRCPCRGPTPASVTSVAGARGHADADLDPARRRELDRVADEVEEDLLDPQRVADQAVGHLGVDAPVEGAAPSGRPAPTASPGSAAAPRAGEKPSASKVICAASICEKSSRSVMSAHERVGRRLDQADVLALLRRRVRCRAGSPSGRRRR